MFLLKHERGSRDIHVLDIQPPCGEALRDSRPPPMEVGTRRAGELDANASIVRSDDNRRACHSARPKLEPNRPPSRVARPGGLSHEKGPQVLHRQGRWGSGGPLRGLAPYGGRLEGRREGRQLGDVPCGMVQEVGLEINWLTFPDTIRRPGGT